jgi:hypothetical protein
MYVHVIARFPHASAVMILYNIECKHVEITVNLKLNMLYSKGCNIRPNVE